MGNGEDRRRFIELHRVYDHCQTSDEVIAVCEQIDQIERQYDQETLRRWIDGRD